MSFIKTRTPRQRINSIEEAVDAFANTSPVVHDHGKGEIGFRADSAGNTVYHRIDGTTPEGRMLIARRRKDAVAIANVVAVRFDAIDTLFATRQLEQVIAEVYVPKKTPLLGSQGVIPRKTVQIGARQYTQYMMDGTGQFEWAGSGAGSSVPVIDLSGGSISRPVHEARLMAKWDVAQMEAGDLAGMDVVRASIETVRKAAEQIHNRVMVFGDTQKGLQGLLKFPSSVAEPSPGNGDGGSTFWNTKSTLEIIADVNTLIEDGQIDNGGAVVYDTVILPPKTYAYLSVTPYDTASGPMTIMSYLREAFPGVNFVKAYEVASTWTDNSEAEGQAVAIDTSLVDYRAGMAFEQGSIIPVAYGLEIPFRVSSGGIHSMSPMAIRYMRGIEV